MTFLAPEEAILCPMSEDNNPESYISKLEYQQFGLTVGSGYKGQLETPFQDSQTKSAFRPGEVRRLLEHSPGFIAVVRGDSLTFELVNSAFAELVGSRDFLGRGLITADPDAS